MITKIYFKEAYPWAPKDSRKFSGRGFHASDGWSIQIIPGSSPQEVELQHSTYGRWLVKGVPFEVFYAGTSRALKESDYIRMNLPKEFWDVSLDKLPESIELSVRNYCENVAELVSEGLGFFLSGAEGTGKSSAAALMARSAVLAGKTAFFITVSDLRELVRNRIPFDKDQSVLDRCKEVDLLVLDHLSESDAKEQVINAVTLESLIESRVQWRRSTILTTRLKVLELKPSFGSLAKTLQTNSPFLNVVGEDLRKSKASSAAKRLVIKPTKD